MALSRSILQHTIVYSLATILGRMASFLMLPFYAHIFDAEGYGIIGMIDTTLGIFTILLAGGFQTAILRIYHEQDAAIQKDLTLSTGIWLVLGISVSIVILPLIFSVPLSRFVLGNPEYYPLFCLALVTFVVDVTGQSASTTQIIHQQSLLFSSVGILRLFLGLALNIWLVVILRVGLIGIFISSFVSAAVASAIFLTVALREHGLNFNVLISKDLLRFQLPLLPGEIIAFAGRQAERILVRILIGLQGMGVLEMAYKFPPLLNMFITIPFQRAWRTKCIEIASQKGAPQTISIMLTKYYYMMVLTGLVLAVTIGDILEVMTPPKFWPASRIAQVEILTTIMTGCGVYMTFGLIYAKQTKTLSLIKASLTPLKIGLGFVLITVFGLTGAAYSALIIEIITLIWIGCKSQSAYKVPIQYWRLLSLTAFALIIFFVIETNFFHKTFLYDFSSCLYNFFMKFIDCSLNLSDRFHDKIHFVIYEKKHNIISIIINVFSCLFYLLFYPIISINNSNDRML